MTVYLLSRIWAPYPKLASVIPEEMIALLQWVGWLPKLEKDPKSGKMVFKKVPINPNTRRYGSTNKPETWGTFETALANVGSHRGGNAWNYLGIGFVFHANQINGLDLIGIDWDNIDAEGLALIRKYRPFTEISPSGSGRHSYILAKWPSGITKTIMASEFGSLFVDRAYFTVTGHLEDGCTELNEQQELLDIVIKRYFSKAR